ncbi:MAG TPA: D-glucuronyl C5-epimerase family protein [Gaiellaceae bacterium]|nr:D-glucuronyl C5-epimerase family protein [Gaiellaceae bacterium]
MLRAAGVIVLAMLAGAAPANAGPPGVTISASATSGAAPLTVTFQASGDAASYHWDLGNGQTADGPTAGATYGPGLWTVTVTATAGDGTTAQASVTVRSVAVTLLPAAEARYGKPAAFRGRVEPALAGEPVSLYVGGLEVATALAEADGTFRLRLPHARTPGPYEARTPVAASAPVALGLHPVLRARFVGARAVGGRLALTVRALPAAAGTISVRLYRDGKLVRKTRVGPAARLAVDTDRVAGYRAIVRVEPAKGWLGAVRIARTEVLCTRDGPGDGLVFYGGGGYQPLLSFAALNQLVLEQRCGAVRRLASALLSQAVHSGDAVYWDYNFPFQGGPVPWTSGFAQAVGAQALARAGVMLRDPALTAAAAASFRGLHHGLLIPLAGGSWIREYGFTGQVILNAQLQSIISLQSYAAVADSAPARSLVRELVVATVRLLPSFDLGCWARYQLGGGAASLHYQTYHVELLRRLAATHPEPIWRSTYLRWRRCLSRSP